MAEDNYLPISAVERYAFCPRQAYLFHAERQRADNLFTVEGTQLHAAVTEEGEERRGTHVITRAVQLVNHRLGVAGVADVVEFKGRTPVPIEYKRGGKRGRDCEHAQVCLQALCLEEMLGVPVSSGFIYHAATRRREPIVLDAFLRAKTESLVASVQQLLRRPNAPRAYHGKHCASCSLEEHCLPRVTGGKRTASFYLTKVYQ